LPRPDSQSYTKFLISAGVFLVVAAFVLPGLILRETEVLTMPRAALQEVTPTAKVELERRQGIARSAGQAAPWVAGGFLIVGALLIAIGIPRLKRQEGHEDERAAMERDKLRKELMPQTQGERKEQLEAELEEGAPGSARAGDPDIQVLADLESAVLDRIGEIGPPIYEVRPHVKVKGAPRILLDALMVSQLDQLPDILVEVKVARTSFSKNVGNRVAEMAQQLLRFRNHFDRASVGWLILVLPERPTTAQLDQVTAFAAEFQKDLRVSLIGTSELDDLQLPVPL
jgi:hypothetical protein